MKYGVCGLAICLVAHLSFFAADKPIPDNAEKVPNKAMLILQQLARNLSKIANNSHATIGDLLSNVIQVMSARHQECCGHPTIRIYTDLDLTKKVFKQPAEKYNHIKTLLDEATNQFLAFKEEDISVYTSRETVLATALMGTKPMIEYILSRKEIDQDIVTTLLPMACMYGNVEAVEYLMQKLPRISDMLGKKIPTILDSLSADIPAETKDVFAVCKNAAIIRFEYMLHNNPDLQNIRKKCPFEECQRLMNEAINAQQAKVSGEKN